MKNSGDKIGNSTKNILLIS